MSQDPPMYTREVVVSPAPSHDGAPTVAAYWKLYEDGIHDKTKDTSPPQFALRIYDTTPKAANKRRLTALARTIYEKTWWRRSGVGRGAPDRIEVVAMPLSPDSTDEQRAMACRNHNERETVARDVKWAINDTERYNWYSWAVIVIDRLAYNWEDGLIREQAAYPKSSEWERPGGREANPYGSYLEVAWDLRQDDSQGWADDEPLPEMYVCGHPLISLDCTLQGLRESVEGFYIDVLGIGFCEGE